jgi:hypothetical protein
MLDADKQGSVCVRESFRGGPALAGCLGEFATAVRVSSAANPSGQIHRYGQCCCPTLRAILICRN